MKFGNLILIFLLFSLAFSAHGWEVNLDETIGTEPVMFGGNMIIGSYEGTVFALDPDNGGKVWEKEVGASVADIEIFNNKLLVILDKGTVYLMKDNGVIQDQEELNSQVYGVYVESGKAYISTERGVAIYDGEDMGWLYQEENSYTTPVVYGNNVIVGKGDKLVSINNKGNITWETELGPFWNSKPVINSDTVYIGSMNHYIYAVDADDGEKKWFFGTEGAVTATALVSAGTVYIGSNDGYLYAIDSSSGEMKWKGKTNGGIDSKAAVSNIGSESVVLVGSEDSYIYGFKRNNGELIWGYSTKGKISSISLFTDEIFVVSEYYMYYVPTERSCVITDPADRTKVGYKEVEVKGKVFSEYSSAGASISVNGGPWVNAQTDENGTFVYTLDPNNYFFGVVEVECKVVDSAGQSSTTTTLVLIRSTDMPQPEFKLEYPSSVGEGSEIIIKVYDLETGEGVKNFDYIINGDAYKSEESIVTINAGSSEELNIKFTKPGYIDKSIIINVESDLTLYIIGFVVLVIVLGIVWFMFLRKKK